MTAAERAAELLDDGGKGRDGLNAARVAALMAHPGLLREMADEADPESAAHDSATFAACLALADVVRRFLLQNYETLTTLDSIGALSSEAGLSVLRNAIMKADAARAARVTAARATDD